MAEKNIFYRPNPSHKKGTTEAGPPKWGPHKSACPEDLTKEDIDELLDQSVSESDDPLDPKRYAVRRLEGKLQWFQTHLTLNHADGRIEVHGFPIEPGYPKIPPKVLRKFRDQEVITEAEYNRATKQ